jgi:hypothetical protein
MPRFAQLSNAESVRSSLRVIPTSPHDRIVTLRVQRGTFRL